MRLDIEGGEQQKSAEMQRVSFEAIFIKPLAEIQATYSDRVDDRRTAVYVQLIPFADTE